MERRVQKECKGGETASRRCPDCHSDKIWKDGIRLTGDGKVQRYLCRRCGYRFSLDKPRFSKSTRSNILSRVGVIGGNCQVCVTETKEAKNLVKVETRKEQAAGATISSDTDTKSRILEFAWQLKRRGLASSTITQRVYRMRHLSQKGAALLDPESISTILAQSGWTDSNKQVFIVAYKSFAKMFSLSWTPPKTRISRKMPFIPTETEIDQLIAGCGKRTASFLQVLKDTGARGCEASKLCWTEVDEKSCTIRINHPVNGSLARIVKVSPKTVAMIMALTRTQGFIFNQNVNTIRKSFMKQRKRIAQTLQNPRLMQIHFHTLRHWKAIMEYHRTKNILCVK